MNKLLTKIKSINKEQLEFVKNNPTVTGVQGSIILEKIFQKIEKKENKKK